MRWSDGGESILWAGMGAVVVVLCSVREEVVMEGKGGDWGGFVCFDRVLTREVRLTRFYY